MIGAKRPGDFSLSGGFVNRFFFLPSTASTGKSGLISWTQMMNGHSGAAVRATPLSNYCTAPWWPDANARNVLIHETERDTKAQNRQPKNGHTIKLAIGSRVQRTKSRFNLGVIQIGTNVVCWRKAPQTFGLRLMMLVPKFEPDPSKNPRTLTLVTTHFPERFEPFPIGKKGYRLYSSIGYLHQGPRSSGGHQRFSGVWPVQNPLKMDSSQPCIYNKYILY